MHTVLLLVRTLVPGAPCQQRPSLLPMRAKAALLQDLWPWTEETVMHLDTDEACIDYQECGHFCMNLGPRWCCLCGSPEDNPVCCSICTSGDR